MKTQAEINQDWQKDYSANVGRVMILTPPEIKCPPMSDADIKRTVIELRNYLRERDRLFQCWLVESKARANGRKIEIFILSFAPGLCGDPKIGATDQQWSETIAELRGYLSRSLRIDDAPLYAEDWSEGGKFQARFEAKIPYSLGDS